MRNAASVLDDSIANESIETEAYTEKGQTFHQTKLRVHYRAITKAISNKRSYRMSGWRENLDAI